MTRLHTAAIGAVVGFSLALLGIFAYSTHRTNQWQTDLIHANERAAHYQLAYNEAAHAWEDRAFQFTESERLRVRLEEENEALARDLERREATMLSLQHTVSNLEAELNESHTAVEQDTPSSYLVNLNESVSLAGGGHLSVVGNIRLITSPLAVETDLAASGRFPLSITISQNDDGEVIVNAYTGDDRLVVSRLDVDWTAHPPRRGSTGFLDAVAGQLFGLDAWANRAIGFAVCTAISR